MYVVRLLFFWFWKISTIGNEVTQSVLSVRRIKTNWLLILLLNALLVLFLLGCMGFLTVCLSALSIVARSGSTGCPKTWKAFATAVRHLMKDFTFFSSQPSTVHIRSSRADSRAGGEVSRAVAWRCALGFPSCSHVRLHPAFRRRLRSTS